MLVGVPLGSDPSHDRFDPNGLFTRIRSDLHAACNCQQVLRDLITETQYASQTGTTL